MSAAQELRITDARSFDFEHDNRIIVHDGVCESEPLTASDFLESASASGSGGEVMHWAFFLDETQTSAHSGKVICLPGVKLQSHPLKKTVSIKERIQQLHELTKEANWDSDDGVAIPLERWREAAWFVGIVQNFFPKYQPFVSPCGDGSVHVEWTKDGDRATLEFCENAYYWNLLSADSTLDTVRKFERVEEISTVVARFLG